MASPSATEIESWETIAVETVGRAANLIRRSLDGVAAIGLKSSPTDVVTQTDVDAELLIRRLVLEATPTAGIIGEEGGNSSPSSPLQWIIDPLDGTVNFTYAVPIFAVSVAAAFNGVIVAGAVIDVIRSEVFSASQGSGARRNGEPIHVSGCTSLDAALTATGYSYRAEVRRQQGEVTHRLLPLVRDLRCFGSAALEWCWLASGRIDAYYERDTKLWDYAAGSLIAAEAGAVVELPCPENEGLVLGAPPPVFEQLRSELGR